MCSSDALTCIAHLQPLLSFAGRNFFLRERVYAFFAAAFFAGAFAALALLGAVVFRTAALGALDLVTRPDLVLPRTTGAFSSTAGAYGDVSRRLEYCEDMHRDLQLRESCEAC